MRKEYFVFCLTIIVLRPLNTSLEYQFLIFPQLDFVFESSNPSIFPELFSFSLYWSFLPIKKKQVSFDRSVPLNLCYAWLVIWIYTYRLSLDYSLFTKCNPRCDVSTSSAGSVQFSVSTFQVVASKQPRSPATLS